MLCAILALVDERLTIGDHVDSTVRKANRALGLLMRTFQTGKHGRHLKAANQRSIMSTYFANVRSILEYCSVVWGGAARTHMQRLERVQHKFLVWLSARCRVTGSYAYQDLVARFNVTTMAARIDQHDILFLRNIHRHRICSSFLLEKFPLAVPARQLRTRQVFATSFARVNTVKLSVFNRAPRTCNAFLEANPDIDVWQSSANDFKKRVAAYVREMCA